MENSDGKPDTVPTYSRSSMNLSYMFPIEIEAGTKYWRDCPLEEQAEEVLRIILRYDEHRGDKLVARQKRDLLNRHCNQKREPQGAAFHCHSQIREVIRVTRIGGFSYDGTMEQFMYLVNHGSILQEMYACLRIYEQSGVVLWRNRALWLCACWMLDPDKKKAAQAQELFDVMFRRVEHALEELEGILLPQSELWLEELDGVLSHAEDGEEEGYSEAG
eukprot:GHVU01181620.1.p1 GENE.GHVU01181620.1~~GHVU01181620.1.p1  ORF type:complete len:232 (+),score=24.99 GHVU01181620.1:44-697(+)